jgi:acetyl-CoA C-acetyltransferase
MNEHDPVIVEAVRTPIGKNQGFFKDTRADDLGVFAVQGLLERSRISPREIEDLVFGCVTARGEQGGNVARLIALEAGLPIEAAGTTVNRLCGSSQQAVNFAAQEILAGVCDCVIAGGVEAMTREPMGSDIDKPLNPKLMELYEIVWQGESAERVADRWELTRSELDEFALQSHLKASQAIDEGHYASQILPMTLNGATLAHDEGVRRYASSEEGRSKLAKLMPAFRPDGRVTAGNSSQISDGAAALLLMTRKKARALGYKPRARFRSFAVAGVDPTLMLTGPIPATRKALEKAGLTLKDIDLFECNEAFASVPVAWGRELDIDWERVNVNGGAIAHGHPLGATGAILITKILYKLERRDAQFGLVTMCIGFGQGIATIIERL